MVGNLSHNKPDNYTVINSVKLSGCPQVSKRRSYSKESGEYFLGYSCIFSHPHLIFLKKCLINITFQGHSSLNLSSFLAFWILSVRNSGFAEALVSLSGRFALILSVPVKPDCISLDLNYSN